MPENTKKTVADAYDFGGLRFSPQNAKVVCLETRKEVFLRRNLSEFLFLLLEKPRETVEYREFRDKVAAWTIYKDVGQVIRTIHTTKGELVKNLRLLRANFDLIEAVPAKGYRLSADVIEFFASGGKKEIFSEKDETNFTETPKIITEQKTFGGHFRQAFFASAVYASLYVVALFIEIAYRFDEFKNLAFKSALPVFLWIWIASLAGLSVGAKLAKKSVFSGFVLTMGIFLFAAFVLHFALGFFLPSDSVTEASFQTYSAHAAYLKSVFYFLGLGIFLIVMPFVSLVRLEIEAAKNDKNVAAHLRRARRRVFVSDGWSPSPEFLLGLTVIALLASLLLTAHLFENLLPNPHLNLFMQLVLLRWFLYFALAAECLVWYRTSLKRLQAQNLESSFISNPPAKQKPTSKTAAASGGRS